MKMENVAIHLAYPVLDSYLGQHFGVAEDNCQREEHLSIWSFMDKIKDCDSFDFVETHCGLGTAKYTMSVRIDDTLEKTSLEKTYRLTFKLLW